MLCIYSENVRSPHPLRQQQLLYKTPVFRLLLTISGQTYQMMFFKRCKEVIKHFEQRLTTQTCSLTLDVSWSIIALTAIYTGDKIRNLFSF